MVAAWRGEQRQQPAVDLANDPASAEAASDR